MTGVEYGAAVLARLRALAEEEPARERCGLVTRVGGRLEVVPVANVAADPAARFDMDPAALLRIHGELAASGGEMVAAWHSHVEGGAALSARDREEAVVGGRPLLPGAEQLVLGMRAGRVTEVRRYRFTGGGFVELPLRP
jgi:proteasome lid subunit RPN8/RPN11